MPYFKGNLPIRNTQGQTIVKQKLSGIVCHFYPNNADAIIQHDGSIVESVPHSNWTEPPHATHL